MNKDKIDRGSLSTDPGTTESKPKLCLDSMAKVDFGAVSDAGKVRKNNEDHYLIGRLGRSLDPLMTNMPDGLLPDRIAEYGYGMVVADGMGGAAAGEVASRK
jgi:protein phosphatase